MASLYRKPCAETMKEDGESGYQSDGKWNKYAKRLDACDFFAGCGKKNGEVDHCAIAYCYWLFLNVITDNGDVTDDDRKYMTHYAMYQSDSCCTSAGCEQQVQVYKDHGAWFTDPKELVVGDQIFFWRWDEEKGRMVHYHTGGCYDWDDEGVYVTEANVNGGKTENRFYPYSEFGRKIAGFGHPRFDGYEIEPAEDSASVHESELEPANGSATEPQPEYMEYRVCVSSRLRVRGGPGTNYSVIGMLPNGYIVNVYEEDCGWGRVDEYKEQWVSMDYLEAI